MTSASSRQGGISLLADPDELEVLGQIWSGAAQFSSSGLAKLLRRGLVVVEEGTSLDAVNTYPAAAALSAQWVLVLTFGSWSRVFAMSPGEWVEVIEHGAQIELVAWQPRPRDIEAVLREAVLHDGDGVQSGSATVVMGDSGETALAWYWTRAGHARFQVEGTGAVAVSRLLSSRELVRDLARLIAEYVDPYSVVGLKSPDPSSTEMAEAVT